MPDDSTAIIVAGADASGASASIFAVALAGFVSLLTSSSLSNSNALAGSACVYCCGSELLSEF